MRKPAIGLTLRERPFAIAHCRVKEHLLSGGLVDTRETPGRASVIDVWLLAGHGGRKLTPAAIVVLYLTKPPGSANRAVEETSLAFFLECSYPPEQNLPGVEDGRLVRVTQRAGEHPSALVLDVTFPVGHAHRALPGILIARKMPVSVKCRDDVSGRLGIRGRPATAADQEGLRHSVIGCYVVGAFQPRNRGVKMDARGFGARPIEASPLRQDAQRVGYVNHSAKYVLGPSLESR